VAFLLWRHKSIGWRVFSSNEILPHQDGIIWAVRFAFESGLLGNTMRLKVSEVSRFRRAQARTHLSI
jgi:hypothetical protein